MIIYFYGRLQIFDEGLFREIGIQINELIELKEKYSVKDAAFALWGFSKYYLKGEIPKFNKDISAIILPRYTIYIYIYIDISSGVLAPTF